MNIEIWKIFIYKRDELFNNAEKKLIQGIKLVRELIHEDNTSLSFYSEVEKSITKAASEEKITSTFNWTKQLKRTTQMQRKKRTIQIQRKKSPKKENSKITFAKKEKQNYSDHIPHRREFPGISAK